MLKHFASLFIICAVKQPNFLNHDGRTDNPVMLDVEFGFVIRKYVKGNKIVDR